MHPYDLLFGILACQLRLITRSTLVRLADSFDEGSGPSLTDTLLAKEILNADDHALLIRLVDNIIHAHHGDEREALNTFGGEEAVQKTFSKPLEDIESVLPHRQRTVQATSLPHGLPLEIAPEAVGRYTGGSEYARGGIGRILLVHDEQIGRDVILKELLPHHEVNPSAPTISRLPDKDSPGTPIRHSAAMMARFLQEAKITGQLEHPSIVPVYELGLRNDGQLYYTMKLVRGKTMAVAIGECKTQDDRIALLRPYLDMCQAMAYAHSKGVIHRDLKPSNVMVGEFGECVVLDWGLAKSGRDKDAHQKTMEKTISHLKIPPEKIGEVKTQVNDVLGTPLYMSPEQARAESDMVGPHSDVYSLGVILYEILTGELPHDWSNTLDTIRRVGTVKAPSICIAAPDTPPELAAICDKALKFDAKERYTSAKDLARDMRHFLEGAVVDAYAYKVSDILRRLYRQHKVIINAALTVSLIVLLVGIVSYVNIYQARLVAEQERAIAVEQTKLAESARETSEEQRQRAEAAEERTAQEKYVSDIRLADVFVRDYNFGSAVDTLIETSPTQRGFEWHALLAECHQELATLDGHTRDVFAHVSRDGSRILTLSGDNTARLWDAISEQPLFTWDFPGTRIADGSFSPSGDRVAIWTGGGELRLYDPVSGDALNVWNAHSGRIHMCAFNTTGDVLASTGSDRVIRLWNVESKQLLLEIPTPEADAMQLRYAADGQHLLAIPRGGPLQLFDTQTGIKLAESATETYLLRAINDILLVAMGDELTLLSDSTLAEQRRFPIGEAVSNADYHPASDTLLYLSRDGELKIWNAATQKKLHTLDNPDPSIECMFSHDGTAALVRNQNNRMRTFDTQSGDLIREFGGHRRIITSIELAPDDAYVLTGSLDGTAKKWSLRDSLNSAPRATLPAGYAAIQVSGEGNRMVVTARDGRFGILDLDQNILVYHGQSPRKEAISKTALSPDGRRLCVALDDFLPLVIDVDTGVVLSKLRGHAGHIRDIQFNGDGTEVLTASWDSTARIWNAETGTEVAVLRGHNDTIYTAAFSPDDMYVVTGGRDNTAIVWDRQSASPLFTIPHESPVFQCAFSQDGAQVASADSDGVVLLWDVAGRAELHHMNGNPSYLQNLSFSSDGRRLVSTASNGEFAVWDTKRGVLLTAFTNDTNPQPAWRRFLGSSDTILSATGNGTITQNLDVPVPPSGPIQKTEDLKKPLVEYRAKRSAWPVPKYDTEPITSTDYYLPLPQAHALLSYLRDHEKALLGNATLLPLGDTAPSINSVTLKSGDVVTSIAGRAPSALFAATNATEYQSLLDGLEDFEISLLREGRVMGLRIHRQDIIYSERTITLTHAEARKLMQAARSYLRVDFSNLSQINQSESAASGISPEGGLWIPSPRSREDCEALRAVGLEALVHLTTINGKPIPVLEELGDLAASSIIQIKEDQPFSLRVQYERGAFEVVDLLLTN